MSAERCTCVPPGDPSVIGACACPTHGMKALRTLLREFDAYATTDPGYCGSPFEARVQEALSTKENQ